MCEFLHQFYLIILEIPIRNWNYFSEYNSANVLSNIRDTYKELKPIKFYTNNQSNVYIRDTYKELKPKNFMEGGFKLYNIRDTYKELKHIITSFICARTFLILEIPIRNWNFFCNKKKIDI